MRREQAVGMWPVKTPSDDSRSRAEQARVAWPNIAAIQGRLLALGRPETLRGTAELIDLHGAAQAISGAVVRPVFVSAVTPAVDREWVADVQRRWPDHRLIFVGGRALLARQ